jgi:hypothetical protein
MSVSEHKFDRDVTENSNDLNTNVMTRCLWVSFCSDKILLNVECDIMIWLSSIHDFYKHMMFIFFSRLYSRHDIIVFVDFAQLCYKNLISRIIVLFMRWKTDHFFIFSRFDLDCSKMLAIWVVRCMCFVAVCVFRRYVRTWFDWLAYWAYMSFCIMIFCAVFASCCFFARVDQVFEFLTFVTLIYSII